VRVALSEKKLNFGKEKPKNLTLTLAYSEDVVPCFQDAELHTKHKSI
jgi:hypothetical protein